MSAVGMDTVCDICGGDPNKCDEEQERQQGNVGGDLAYEVKSKS
jgi:hypothetical protein